MINYHDLIIRSNRTDYKIKDRECWGTRRASDAHEIIFILEQTRGWFAHNNFTIKPGFKVLPVDDPDEYVITSISYPEKRPFKTILTTVRV